jgi:hypothetical protein
MFSATWDGEVSAASAAFSMSFIVMLDELPWSSLGAPHPQLAHMSCPFPHSRGPGVPGDERC